MATVYIDTLFLMNTVINYLILLVSAKICAAPILRRRILLAACLGGAYAVATVLCPAHFLLHGAIKVAVGVGMALVVFGGQQRFFRAVLVFFAVSAAFGGVLIALQLLEGRDLYSVFYNPVSAKVLLLTFGVTYLILSLVFRRATRLDAGAETVEVTATWGSRSISFPALLDTGNGLTDPVTGAPVVVAEWGAVRGLFPEDMARQLESLQDSPPFAVLACLQGPERTRFRLLPYSAVGVGGSLLAVKTDSITVCGRSRRHALIALSPTPVSDGGAYAALVGSSWGAREQGIPLLGRGKNQKG